MPAQAKRKKVTSVLSRKNARQGQRQRSPIVPSPPPSSASPASSSSLMELYQRVVVEGNHSYIRRGKQQQQQSPATTTTSSSSSMSFSGALATLVWPAMVALCGDETATTDKSKSAAPPQRRKHEPNDYVNSGPLPLTLSQCSHLAASLLSLQYASGGVREDSLHFVQPDHVPVWNAWCSCLFSNPDDRMADSNSREQQEHCVHCFGVMWACLSMQPWMAWQTLQLQPALSQHVEHLPTCMPERYREYYLRQQQQQQLNSITSEMDKSNPPEASVVHSHSYVAAFIQQVMHIMEESTSSDRNNLTKLKQQRVDPGNGLNSLNDDDEANGSDDVNDEENNDGVGGDYDDEGVEGTDYSANVAEGDAVVAALDNDEIATRTRDLVRSKIHGDSHSIGWGFLHRALELLITLLSSPTNLRSVLLEYLHSIHWTVRCRHALGSAVSPNSRDNSEARMTHMWQLTQQLLKRITIWMHGFPTVVVDQQSMAPIVMTATERRTLYHERASIFQKMCQRHYAEYLSDIVLAGVGLLCASPKTDSHGVRTTSYLRQALGGLSDSDFMNLMHKMRLFDAHGLSGRLDAQKDRSFLLDVLEDYLVVPPDPLEELQSFPLFPTEELLWDFMRIPPSHGCLSQSPVLSLPKLNTRFLSFADYLWRNFELVRLESAYEIRSDLVDVIRRVRPVLRQASLEDGEDQYTELKTVFSGWARMALEMIGQIEIKRVNKALLGERYPSQVLAEFFVDLGPCGDAIRQEWDTLGEFDNLFLVSIDASTMSGCPAPLLRQRNEARNSTAMNSDRRVSDEDDCTFPQRFGVTLVRGCTIVQIRDEAGTVLSDSSSEIKPSGTKRIFRVSLDPTQFSADRLGLTGTDIYNSLNLVVRRQGKVNNFRSVLETIRGLMAGTGSINRVVPVWLQHALLGYGDPSESSFRSPSMLAFAKATAGIANPESYLDYCDTFLDEEHLRSSFSILSKEVTVDGRANVADHVIERRFSYQVRVVETAESRGIVEAKSYPFPEHVCGNSVRFTPRQVAAIRSGLSPGLSLIVGPPGTGKTDVAVQIIASLYHSFPTQRTIVVTHSNAALNDIFQKVMARGDIEERYLVRLGSGERSLQTTSTHDFTKQGRVAYSLARCGVLLEQVQLLSESLNISGRAERGADGSPAYTCETAEIFNRHTVQTLVRKFLKQAKECEDQKPDEVNVIAIFPFAAYFKVVENVSLVEAKNHFVSITNVFRELDEYRPLELLRTQRQRSDYLIMKQARVVAMTCTHAAIARSHLISLGFEYDNIVVEEAGQMLEIETFIPLLLQRGETDATSAKNGRLKRYCLIGDHNQLPPVVQNASFAKYSNLDQSMFLRLIRLGAPYIELNKQGRSRPEIASLYSWRYSNLGNLEHVCTSNGYTVANAGLSHTFQLVNVDNYEGKGETAPTLYFYQNVGEAEYAVALFQYLVLIGHAPQSISILTTYNGQRELIMDIISQRCGHGTPLAGVRPRAVSTVDQYQGQQNDIVLLSLVRTETVGHLRDARRLVVAVSRARLGLYVFCRQEMFETCYELNQTFAQLVQRPTKLQLVTGENYPTERLATDPIPSEQIYEVDDVGHMGSIVHQMQQDLINST